MSKEKKVIPNNVPAYIGHCCPVCGGSLAQLQQGFKVDLPVKGGGYQSVIIYDISYIRADDNYSEVNYVENAYTGKMGMIIIRKTLKDLQEYEQRYNIVRIERSFMINTQHIIYRGSGGLLRLKHVENTDFFVSKNNLPKVNTLLKKWDLPPLKE